MALPLEFIRALRETERRAARQSPFYMAKYVMGRSLWVDGVAPVWEPLHVEACVEMWRLWITRSLRPWGTIYRLEWPRDTRKSTLFQAVALCALVNNANARFLVNSDTWENAAKKMGVVKRMFDDPHFIELFGSLRGEPWNETGITLKRTAKLSDPSMTASGLNAEKTSQHYEGIGDDDLQTDGNSQNEEQLAKVAKDFKLYDSLGTSSGGYVIFSMGTRWGFNDQSAMISKMAEDDRRQGRPQRIFFNRKHCAHKNEDGKYDLSKPVFPTLLPETVLRFKRASQGAFLFSCNYLVDPESEETALIKKEDISYHNKTIDELKAMGCYFLMGIDPSKEGTSASRDFDALVVVAVTPRAEIFVCEALALRVNRQKLFERIVALAQQYPLRKVMIETRFQQHELASWLKTQSAVVPVHIPWEKFKQDDRTKEHRVQQFALYFNAKLVRLREHMTEFENQLLNQGKSGIHDDLNDAFSFCVDMIDVPLEKQEGAWWLKNPNYGEELEARREAGEANLPPDARTIRHWRTIRREKERGRQAVKLRHIGMG